MWEPPKTGKHPITVKWIDVNKGDDKNPNHRSRYVGTEYNTGPEEGLFVSTPPIEGLRFLVSDAATCETGRKKRGKGRQSLMVNDVSHAFFEAKATRMICVELPKEDLEEG